MLLSETLCSFSIENFVTEQEVTRLLAIMGEVMAARSPEEIEAGHDGKSVHRLVREAADPKAAVKIYEPEGRVELKAPPTAIEILENAAFRRIEDIRRPFPSATWPRGWVYVEYGPGQFCTSHADRMIAAADQRVSGTVPRQVVGGNVNLNDDYQGGEFYVETCGAPDLWVPSARGPLDVEVGPWVAYNNPLFSSIPKTRWATKPAKGTALFYGSQLIHGTQPVREGRVKKFLCFYRDF